MGCYSARFTQDNIMKLRLGMTDHEVLATFGKPLKTEARTCGQGLGEPWTCIIWYYGEWKPRLVFAVKSDGSFSLSGWDF